MEINSLTKLVSMPGTMKLTSNGEGAKTTKVTIVANSGQPYWYDDMGWVVQDMAGMTSKPRIPLDWEHDQSIGYLSNFDTSGGQLVCGGAITVSDVTIETSNGLMTLQALADHLSAGVPYEASIEYEVDEAEYLPDGMTTVVNGNTVNGPIVIMRKWNLMAVAICKFGKDAQTSVRMAASKKQPLFIKLSSKGDRYMSMDKNDPKINPMEVKAVEPKVEGKAPAKASPEVIPEPVAPVVKPDDVKPVEADGKAPEVTPEDDKAEVKETDDKVTVIPDVPLGKPQEAPVQLSQTVEATDPRAEYKLFAELFGNEKAGEYFGSGLSLPDATAKHLAYQGEQIKQLSKKVDGLDRGGKAPVRMSMLENDKPKGKFEDVIKIR